jgi:hypothetical protein
MNCSNCNAKFTCGCQRRVATDGKVVCSACVSKYEEDLKKQKEESNKNNPPNS